MDRDTQTRRSATRPGSRRSTWIVIGCALGSFLAHGVAYGVLRKIPRPAVKEREHGPIYQRRPEKKKPHRVKVVRKKRAPQTRPRPAAMRPAPVKRRIIRKLRPMAPPPRALARRPTTTPPMAPPALDLTRSAGVSSRLTAGSGAGGFQTGTTALGDPTVAPNKTKRAPRPAVQVAAMGPPSAPAPAAVYLKRLPQVVAVPRMPYPAGARKRGIQGTVKLLVTIGSNGRALRVRVLRSLDRELDRLAVRALKRARFRPAMGTDGKPMTYTIRYRYTFRLAT